MRLRLPELLAEHRVTPYRLAKDSGGRIAMSTAYRLASRGGQSAYFEAKILSAICDVFGVGPESLFSRDDEVPPVPVRAAKRGRKAK